MSKRKKYQNVAQCTIIIYVNHELIWSFFPFFFNTLSSSSLLLSVILCPYLGELLLINSKLANKITF